MTKKNHTSPVLTPESEAEALVVQHALAFYRDMKRNAKNAPIGQFLNCAEAIVLTKGRELLCTSLETLAQEEVNEVEKKNETRLCRQCKKKKRHLGGKTKNIETAAGTIKVKRRYDECRPCALQEFIVDTLLGIEDGYTVGLRRLAVYGAAWIWNIVREVFGAIRQCLDVYHGLEHVSATGKVLYGEGTEEYKQWQEE